MREGGRARGRERERKGRGVGGREAWMAGGQMNLDKISCENENVHVPHIKVHTHLSVPHHENVRSVH